MTEKSTKEVITGMILYCTHCGFAFKPMDQLHEVEYHESEQNHDVERVKEVQIPKPEGMA